jgi:DNA topoisomerase VI subunit B
MSHKVEVARDHVQTLIGGSPFKAVVELIWNALDAGVPLVDVTLRANDLSSIDTIEVADQGPGIPPEELPEAIGKIGNSKKVRERENPDGRDNHGKEGKGRFKALLRTRMARSGLSQAQARTQDGVRLSNGLGTDQPQEGGADTRILCP